MQNYNKAKQGAEMAAEIKAVREQVACNEVYNEAIHNKMYALIWFC